MLRLKRQIINDRRCVELSGPEHLVMLFYVSWKARVWKEYLVHPSIFVKGSYHRDQVTEIVKDIGAGKKILLDISDPQMYEAYEEILTSFRSLEFAA